jgi:hypothetical protein
MLTHFTLPALNLGQWMLKICLAAVDQNIQRGSGYINLKQFI